MELKDALKEIDQFINGLNKTNELKMDNETDHYPPGTDPNVILNNVRKVERTLLAQNLKLLRDKIA